MRRRKFLETLSAGLLAASLVAAGLASPAVSASAATTTVLSVTFDDSTLAPLTASGSPTLGYVDGDVAGKALSVSERVNTWDTVQTPTGIFQTGKDYTLSAQVRLAPGTTGTRNAHFTVDDGSYAWVGTTAVSADAWSAVSGTYTLPAGVDPATVKVSIEADAASTGDTTLPSFLLDDVMVVEGDPATPGQGQPAGTEVISADFEDGLQGWVPRASGTGPGVLEVTPEEAHGGSQSASLTARTSQGDGIGFDVTDVLVPGTSYELSAWVRFAPGQTVDDIWLSMSRTVAGATTYDTIGSFTGMSSSDWVLVTTRFQMGQADSALLYFETTYDNGATGNISDILLDDVSVVVPVQSEVQDLLPIKDTLPFPVGVAVDSRETTGPAAELLLQHFDQVTPENYMKPEAWYDSAQQFAPGPESDALMAFGRDEGVTVYGHTLVWHSQTPAWFFQDGDGVPLTTSVADQEILKERMRTHIFAVAEYLSDGYGAFGSDTNPLTAFDVVNEVVADGAEYADGLRRSEWYRILGEEFIDLAFEYADEAFNDTYAAPGADRPVTLFINDYNTEQVGKQDRLHALVSRLLSRGAPVDGVGHQFHVSLATPVSTLEDAIAAFEDLPVTQAVTELDVTTGTPVTDAKLVEQGYFYRDAFRVFRDHADSLFSVTLWGLTDGRSWRVDSGAPLVFDDDLQAKPAYYGIVDGDLGARVRTADVFRGDVPLDDQATTALAWQLLPLHDIGDQSGFQLRWETDHLTAYVTVEDATPDSRDGIEFAYGGVTSSVGRDGVGDIEAVVSERDGGYLMVVHLPVTVTEGSSVPFDIRVSDDGATAAWNTPGAMGALSLREPLSYLGVVEASQAPVIDGIEDAGWATAGVVETNQQIEGQGGAVASVRTVWHGDTLYVLATVVDADVDVSGSDPWAQDSVEIFVDSGNYKNGSYRYDDTQIRISATNTVSFGAGDEAFQRARVTTATRLTDDGYVVEAAVTLQEEGGAGTFHGLDFQVNDAAAGVRHSVRTWADPTGTGYQTTARWGVGQLMAADAVVTPIDPAIVLGASAVQAGEQVAVTLSGFEPGSVVDIVLTSRDGSGAGRVLASVTAGEGAMTTQVLVPAGTAAGEYVLAATVAGEVLATAAVTVTAAAVTDAGGGTVTAPVTAPVTGPAAGSGPGSGGAAASLATTGAQVGVTVMLALALLAAGTLLVRRRQHLATAGEEPVGS